MCAKEYQMIQHRRVKKDEILGDFKLVSLKSRHIDSSFNNSDDVNLVDGC